MKKDKQKVIGEEFNQERILTFLTQEAPKDQAKDFYALERAYQGMIAKNFAQFVEQFVAQGRNIQALNKQGQSLLELIKKHKKSQEYVATLEQYL